jgi:biopolymer transport protein ExbB
MEIMVRGGPVMWPLLFCSIVALTVIIERALFWIRESWHRDEDRLDRLLDLAQKGDFARALEESASSGDAPTRTIRAGLLHREHGLREAMEVAAGEEMARMKKGMAILDTIITMAPLLGILGTVTGIIKSFDLLGAMQIEDPRGVATGIAEALLTTAAGLIIALGTLLPFNYFISRIQQESRRLEQLATQFEVAYRKGCARETDQRV